MTLALIAMTVLTPSPVGTYVGGTGTGEDHIVELKSNGTGAWHFHGCFHQLDWNLSWSRTADRITLNIARPRAKDGWPSPPRHGDSNYVAADWTYEVRQFGSDRFLVPVKALARFANDGRRGLIVYRSYGRGPYLRLRPEKQQPSAPPNRALILAP